MPEPTLGQEWTDDDVKTFVTQLRPVMRNYILNNLPVGLATPNFRTYVRIVFELQRQLQTQASNVAIN